MLDDQAQMFSVQHIIRFKSIDQYFTKTIKNRSRRILRLWTDHCEYIIAQRIRRSQQMICLYRRIWDEQALRWIVQQLRKQVKSINKLDFKSQTKCPRKRCKETQNLIRTVTRNVIDVIILSVCQSERQARLLFT